MCFQRRGPSSWLSSPGTDPSNLVRAGKSGGRLYLVIGRVQKPSPHSVTVIIMPPPLEEAFSVCRGGLRII